MAVRYWHWLLYQKQQPLPVEYAIRGTAINVTQFEPDWDGEEIVPERGDIYYSYYNDYDNIKPGETVKVYYFWEYDSVSGEYIYTYFYVENGEVVYYTPTQPDGEITFNVKFMTDGVVDDDFTTITVPVQNNEWEFTYPVNKCIYSLENFHAENNDTFTEYGVYKDMGQHQLLTVDFSDADRLNNLVTMDNAFDSCTKLTAVNFAAATFPLLQSANDAFYNCNLIPSVITRIKSVPSLDGGRVGEYSFYKDGIHYYEINTSSDPQTYTPALRCDGYNYDAASNITIPSSVLIETGVTLNVVEIRATASTGRVAFLDCTALSISIPNTVTTIGVRAFYNCGNITSITIPNSVTTIGSNAFGGCENLATVSIPSSVTKIYDGAFISCAMTSITIPNSVQHFAENDLTDFPTEYSYNAWEEYYEYLGQAQPMEGSFYYATNLASITLPNSITTIGRLAFYNCAFTSFVIPNTVTLIDERAFESCSDLTSITIGNAVTRINYLAFYYTTSLTTVVINNFAHLCSIEYHYGIHSDNHDTDYDSYIVEIYLNQNNITAVTVPNTVTNLCGTFANCSQMTEITIPSSVKTMREDAFTKCTGLTKATFASIYDLFTTDMQCGIQFGSINSIVNISNPLFYAEHLYVGQNEVTSITVPNNITEINDYTLTNCKYITTVTIPNTITRIGVDSFYGCTGLTEITIPNSVTEIDNFAFYGCTGLRTVRIPSSVTRIGKSAFNNSNITFYCEAASRPDGWVYNQSEWTSYHYVTYFWNNNEGTVNWGATW